jgi:putative phosphoribosyl transferase
MFKDRIEAGRVLAEKIPPSFITSESLVIGIGLKGIPVACSFASALKLPVDFVIARKVPLIGRPYIAVGAVTSDGTCVLDELILKKSGIRETQLKNYVESVVKELREELIRLRGTYEPPDLTGKDVLIVDDGIASGQTMLAVIKCVKKHYPRSVSAIVPAAAFLGYKKIIDQVNNFYSLRVCNDPNFAVDSFYEEERYDKENAVECINRVKMLGLTAYKK